MRVLLTGATGFFGSHLLRALLARGHEVVCAVRAPRQDAQMNASVRYVPADFTRDLEPAVWLPRLERVDVVINAVGILQERSKQTFDAIHTHAPRALFLACEQAGVPRVIQISALGADEHATSRYHSSKKAADDVLAQLRLRWVIVQPSLVFGLEGASTQLFTMLASMPIIPVLGRGDQQVQPVHIDDVVAAVIALLEPDSPARVRVPVVGPRSLTFVDYLRVLREHMGFGSARVLRVPMPLVRTMAALGSLIPGAMLDRETLQMLIRGNTAAPGVISTLIGRSPRDVEGFIPHAVAKGMSSTALLSWLLPVVRVSIALVWIVTGIVSLGVYPVQDSYHLLARVGVPPILQPLMLYGAAVLDLLIGIGLLLLRRRGWLWLLQITLILGYTVIITVKLPEYWLHPYGPILKNLPMLAAIWLMYEMEKSTR